MLFFFNLFNLISFFNYLFLQMDKLSKKKKKTQENRVVSSWCNG